MRKRLFSIRSSLFESDDDDVSSSLIIVVGVVSVSKRTGFIIFKNAQNEVEGIAMVDV